jgi:hypothetical protein
VFRGEERDAEMLDSLPTPMLLPTKQSDARVLRIFYIQQYISLRCTQRQLYALAGLDIETKRASWAARSLLRRPAGVN